MRDIELTRVASKVRAIENEADEVSAADVSSGRRVEVQLETASAWADGPSGKMQMQCFRGEDENREKGKNRRERSDSLEETSPELHSVAERDIGSIFRVEGGSSRREDKRGTVTEQNIERLEGIVDFPDVSAARPCEVVSERIERNRDRLLKLRQSKRRSNGG